jgi:DNA-binding response OmpR family regulator
MRIVKAILESMLTKDHILLVDDDQEIICSFKSILEDEGYVVYTANDADEAVKVMRDNEVQLAILDYVLPKTRGDKLAETLKAINQKLNIIFVSGYLEVLEATNKLDCGVCGVFLKPVSPEMLLTRVRSLETDPLHAEQFLYSYMTPVKG